MGDHIHWLGKVEALVIGKQLRAQLEQKMGREEDQNNSNPTQPPKKENHGGWIMD